MIWRSKGGWPVIVTGLLVALLSASLAFGVGVWTNREAISRVERESNQRLKDECVNTQAAWDFTDELARTLVGSSPAAQVVLDRLVEFERAHPRPKC